MKAQNETCTMTKEGIKTKATVIINEIKDFRSKVMNSGHINSQEYLDFEDEVNRLVTMSPDQMN